MDAIQGAKERWKLASSVNPGIQIRDIEPALGTATFSPVTVLRQPPKALAPVWLWPNLLGLDAPLVAVSWQLLFARTSGISIPPVIHVVLGLSVWCVYLADRLYDACRAKDFSNGTWRLRFTKQHFAVLATTTAVAACVNLFLIVRFVPGHLLVHGLVTAVLLALYYAFRFGSPGKVAGVVPREIMCGMVFAIGSTIAPFSYSQPETSGIPFLGAVTMLGLVCSASCILISVWERDADLASGDRSVASAKPGIPPRFRKFLLPLVLLYGIVAFSDPWQIHIATGLSALALAAMVRFEGNIPATLLRALADGVLLTPLLFIAFT